LIIIAHGGGWDITAPNAVDEMLKKVTSEHGNAKDLQDNGNFELHYTPANTDRKGFVIPLSNYEHQQPKLNEASNNRNQSHTQDNTISSRH
jgi:hypothetical protein